MPMNYKDNFEMLQKQHKALEAKHKNLRVISSRDKIKLIVDQVAFSALPTYPHTIISHLHSCR